MGVEVVAELRGGIAGAAIDGVAEHAAPARVGHIDPQPDVVFLQVAVHIEVADSWFHHAVGLLLVDLEDAVHALEVEHHRARVGWRRTAIAEVLAGGNGVHGNLEAVGDAHQRLHFLGGGGRDGGRGDALLGFPPVGRIGVAVQMQVLVAGEDPFLADDLTEQADGFGEILAADAWWLAHIVFLLFLGRLRRAGWGR
ncbi:hypothetical protein D9M69_434010 [compost metagenome]